MNRINKRKQYERGYYQTHPCTDSFTCKHCGRPVVSAGAGSDHRNHCPNCLTSLHLDVEPGDRSADCGGLMDAIAVWVRKNGEWAIVHRCRRCGACCKVRKPPSSPSSTAPRKNSRADPRNTRPGVFSKGQCKVCK